MGGVCAVVERAGLTTDDEGSVDYRYIYLRCIIYSYKGSGTTAVILPLCPPKLYRRRRAAVSICPSAIESHAREGACARKTPPSQTAALDTTVNFDSAGDRGGGHVWKLHRAHMQLLKRCISLGSDNLRDISVSVENYYTRESDESTYTLVLWLYSKLLKKNRTIRRSDVSFLSFT